MLTSQEKEGATRLLKGLPESDSLSLAKTVTGNQIVISSKGEAINAIVAYTESPAELLRRKKVLRSFLFSYLANESVVISPKADKNALIQRILQHWGSTPVSDNDLVPMDEAPEPVMSRPGPSSLMALAASKAPLLLSTTHNTTGAQPAVCRLSSPDVVPTHQPSSPHTPGMHGFMTQPAPPSCSGMLGVATAGSNDAELAKAFICWFFPLLNNVDSGSEFGPHHFFNSCMLKVAHGTMGVDAHLEEFNDSTQVAQRLASVVVDKKIKFCPNIDDGKGGYRGISNEVGLRGVKVCGTLHTREDIVGVFEQEFGLVRDPEADFNFRIKFTNLKLMAGKPAQEPTLELTEGLMELPHT